MSLPRPAAQRDAIRVPDGPGMIWHLIDSRSVGGAERHAATLAECLRRHRIPAEAVLYCDYGGNPWLDQLAAARVPVRTLDGSLRGLIRALRRERPGLLHTHGYKAGVVGRLAARLAGIPVVSTFHSGERSPPPVGVYEWLDEWTSFLGQRIAVSDRIQRRLPFPSIVIPSFVAAPPSAPVGPLPPRIGFVGRLSAEKAPDLFCALAERSPRHIEWHIYGDGPMRRELEQRHGARVRFHGVVADLDSVWPALGLLLMPSRFEGVPLAALEALAAGVPVLASRVGGLPGIVIENSTGWLFERENLDEALSHLEIWRRLPPEAQAGMRADCWRHVRDYFSEATQFPRLLAVYARAGYAPADCPTLRGGITPTGS